MNKEFFAALDLFEKEKGISKDYIIERVQAALENAYKHELGGQALIRVMIDPVKEDIKVYRQRTVVEEVTNEITEISLEQAKALSKKHKLGSIVENEVKPKNLRRLSAMGAKSVFIQGIREAERSMMLREYEEKKEEIVTATVDKIDPETGDVVVDTGTSRVTLKREEQIPGETYTVNSKIKVFIMEVKKDNAVRGPLVTISRTHTGLVKRLFELEVPEIQDGTVVIKGISREAGVRTKIAVMSRDENVDPIGACIGSRRMRINSITDELFGEKIDIIKYSEKPEEYISKALAPATVRDVIIDGEKSCRAVVDSDQLSLAIGKEGLNARLAARLTGFKIDIKTDAEGVVPYNPGSNEEENSENE